ncbi:MAG TPA: hypothetical protein VIL17_04935 [Coriobacteriia bacterium]
MTVPDYSEWADRARAGAALAASWDAALCGVPVTELRAMARREALTAGAAFSSRMGVLVRAVEDEPELIVMTGHQPELYHPGIWIKDFLLQRLSDETGAAAIDLVVDSDGFDTLDIHSPCLRPEVRVCRTYLAVGVQDGCYACAPVPSADDLGRFCEAGAENLATLTAPALGHHFARFCEGLRIAATEAENLAELVTFSRRRFEASAGSDYLELPVTAMARSRAFATFVAHLAGDARAFAAAYNAALSDYRERTGTRSAAQPFPDLQSDGDLVELPFWLLDSGRRTVWARVGDSPALVVDGEVVCDLSDVASAADRLFAAGLRLAPKALALTLFTRLLVADLFIHGVGGGRYDQVTDDVFRRYLGIEPIPVVVASMTVYLPLGARVVRDEEIEAVAMALNRLRHNPDQMLDDMEFDTAEGHARSLALSAEKGRLVAEIAGPAADKKAIGKRIREVNAELAALLSPYESELQTELEELRRMQEASGILTDRTYPFCFWSPEEIADKAR